MKTFVLTVAKSFPAYHPKAGQATNFKQQILEGNKIHTIRLNYTLWVSRIKQINSCSAILSLREWSGKPYNSKQVEFMQLCYAGVEHFAMDANKTISLNKVNIFKADHQSIAEHDGLCLSDFYEWFKAGTNTITDAAIIHFTEFKYIRS